jgi:hypothetical protein
MADRLETEEDILAAVRARTGRDPDSRAWAWAVEENWIGDVLDEARAGDAEAGLAALLERLATLRQIVLTGAPRRREPTGARERDLRPETLARILAIEAGRLEEVVAFRGHVLDGRLLDVEEIEEWVQTTKAREGRATRWSSVPRSDKGELLLADAEGLRVESLSYVVPPNPWPAPRCRRGSWWRPPGALSSG